MSSPHYVAENHAARREWAELTARPDDRHLVEQIASGGFGRCLRRSLHRREHIRQVEQALKERP